ncbi:prephenate dehydratase [Stygiolobus caldivivus]|uniref:Prephenate dehydratase n=1 Tax=Stygiolobus caldivivus TaxID=2824673 RepID=A0A8D5ZIF3_9CREN|nr:prephenate dehydratase [Stygiolobus caldivivus]BCU70559.1 prephenate dehydratase [Stygiolobus caldivivus]
MSNDPNGIYFLGPKGSFSNEVADMLEGNKVPLKTISEIFQKVENEDNVIGIVPIENSLEGPVHETLDNLYKYDKIYVNSYVEKEIKLVLAVNNSINKIEDIKRVYSHNHALQEAKAALQRLNLMNIIPVESTSAAALYASKDREAAAICSQYAASLYGLRILMNNIQDNLNITRFIIISKKITINGDRTMIFFNVPHKPGSLYKALEKFYKYNVNLTMIYSRPLKVIPWQYYFYIEFEGELNDIRIKNLIEELRNVVTNIKVKGSYFKLQFQALDFLS